MAIKHARFNSASNPVGHPYRWGFCDGVLERPSECPWKGIVNFIKQAQYIQGYMDGKQSLKKHKGKNK